MASPAHNSANTARAAVCTCGEADSASPDARLVRHEVPAAKEASPTSPLSSPPGNEGPASGDRPSRRDGRGSRHDRPASRSSGRRHPLSSGPHLMLPYGEEQLRTLNDRQLQEAALTSQPQMARGLAYRRRRPTRHSRAYKMCVGLAFVGALSLLALGLTAFAYFRRLRASMRHESAFRRITPDQDILGRRTGSGFCGAMFPIEAHMGNYRMMTSQVFCLFNASAHYRPPTWRFPLGKIPGMLCSHVLYWSVSLNDAAELVSRAEDFDYACKGLDSVADLKRRFMAMKVHLVLSASSPQENVRLSEIAGNARRRRRLVSEFRAWALRYDFDGVFVAWNAPRGLNRTASLFRALVEGLKPRFNVGAILPTSREALAAYDLEEVFGTLDWVVATTHGFYPGPFWNLTSCSSPYKAENRDSIQQLLRYYWNRLNDHIDPSKFCFTISPAAVGYRVPQEGLSLDMPARGPGNIHGEARDRGMLRYAQVCRDESQAAKDLSGLCLYARYGGTWVAFENAKSTSARVKSIMRWLSGVTQAANKSAPYCMTVWDLDLDDHLSQCGEQPFPIIEAAIRELP
ncbi:chitinase-3-like protein 1 isoform X2 [Dermacentor albipictus]